MEENLDKTMESTPKCKCCLGEEDLKDMWTVTTEDDEPEIYGEMLNECFALPWDHQEDDTEFICEFCVQRLKDAVNFKNQIVFAHDVMQDNTDIVTTVDENGKLKHEVKLEAREEDEISEFIKQEPANDSVEYLDVEYLEDVKMEAEKTPNKRKQTFNTDLDNCVTSVQTSLMTPDEAAEYFNVPKSVLAERLKEENIDIPNEDENPDVQNVSQGTSKRRSKRFKKEKFDEDVDNINLDLDNCVTSVQTSLMTPDEAAEYFNVPKSVLAERLKEENIDIPNEDENPDDQNVSQGTSKRRSKRVKKEKFDEDMDDGEDEEVEYLETEFLSDEEFQVNEPPKVNKQLTKANKARVNLKYTPADLENCINAVLWEDMSRVQASKFYGVPYKTLCNKLRAVVSTLEPPKENNKELTNTSTERVYVKYTQADMENCINAVLRKNMTRAQASAYFGIPYKTLCNKLKDTDCVLDKDKSLLNDKQIKLVEEVKLLLTYTNATPFKSKACKYYCAYCNTEGNFYDDTHLLRAHIRTQHTTDKLTGVEIFLRPQSLNEVAKFDIQNLTCTVCCERLESWNGMFQHLADSHQVEFDEAYARVIPYILEQELFCALCKMKYDSFNQLDSHMNAHYMNYVCGSCGDTFMSETRLKKHEETHEIGRYKCQYCDKVFSLSKYRKKHTLFVHLSEENFRCRYCRQGFHSDYSRYLHMIEKHNLKAKTYTCEVCKKSFNWKPYYLKHVRLIHREKVKKHECLLCEKKFSMNYELRNHYEWHQGTTKHVCLICDKKFSSNQYLQKHIMKNHSDALVVLE